MKNTITIAIPAYNEETNILSLINSLLTQDQSKVSIKEILVVSDRSTDKTEEIVRAIKNKRVRLIVNAKRKGKALSQNTIIKETKTDYLVIFDADILIRDRKLIEKLIIPMQFDQAIGLVSCRKKPVKPTTYLEKVLHVSHRIKNEYFERINNGSNIYMCHGAARAFRREFVKKIKFKPLYGEDAFSYLSCIKLGYKFYYNKRASVYFRLPTHIKDHLLQSRRFITSKKGMSEIFSEELVSKSYEYSKLDMFKNVLKFALKQPLILLSYLFIFMTVKASSLIGNKNSGVWSVSKSSKALN